MPDETDDDYITGEFYSPDELQRGVNLIIDEFVDNFEEDYPQ